MAKNAEGAKRPGGRLIGSWRQGALASIGSAASAQAIAHYVTQAAKAAGWEHYSTSAEEIAKWLRKQSDDQVSKAQPPTSPSPSPSPSQSSLIRQSAGGNGSTDLRSQVRQLAAILGRDEALALIAHMME